jgi:archaemetzincin
MVIFLGDQQGSGCGALDEDERARIIHLERVKKALGPLHRKLGAPGPHDWLAHHHEPGETFFQYMKSNPVTPRGRRRILYIQPIGPFSEEMRQIVNLTATFMSNYFNLLVKIRENIPLSVIPARARRTHPFWGVKQILTTFILSRLLKPRLPVDAAAYIAFTAIDLWPGPGWNFVFGQASLRERVAVWSIYRNGDPARNRESFLLCLLRTLKTATHETGHMFSMKHCIMHECNMCGSNHRDESDRRPLALCPECLCKVCWATDADPLERFQRLYRFCIDQGLEKEAAFYQKSIDMVQNLNK